MIDTAFKLAQRFAPAITRRLAGEKAGAVAEQIVSIGGLITGRTDPAEIEAALEANSELAHAFRMQAAELDYNLELAYLEDTEKARAMRVRLAELGKTDWMMYGVGGIVVTGFVTVIISIIFMPELSGDQTNLLYSLAGTLGAAFMAVVGYFFGSSRGSAEKTRLMTDIKPR